MDSISRICATSKGSTIDAIGHGRYRVCNRNAICSEVEGLWQAYETLRLQEQQLTWGKKDIVLWSDPEEICTDRDQIRHGHERGASGTNAMFIIEGLTDNGWSFEARHDSRDNAFWHARAKSDATGRTFRLISQDQQMVCLLTSKGSDCWGMESELVAWADQLRMSNNTYSPNRFTQ